MTNSSATSVRPSDRKIGSVFNDVAVVDVVVVVIVVVAVFESKMSTKLRNWLSLTSSISDTNLETRAK